MEKSWKNPLAEIKYYGRLPAKCQEEGVAIFDLDLSLIDDIQQGSKENIEVAKTQFNDLTDELIKILTEY